MAQDDAPVPTITKVTLALEWDAPLNPQFPVKSYYISIGDMQGNKRNIPLAANVTQYSLDVDITKDDPSTVFVGAIYPIGGAGISVQSVAFNVEPTSS